MQTPVEPADHFLYSPASSYPTPYARLIDRQGATVHTWSHPAAQPPVQDDPPSFLRGWNHVEADHNGNLYAVVPLRALIKLDSRSNLLWQADVIAHHDVDVTADGDVYVLTEEPRQIRVDGQPFVILDNAISVVDQHGRTRGSVSLYEVLTSDPHLAATIHGQMRDKHAVHARSGHHPEAVVQDLLATGRFDGRPTQALRVLRQLPGSPCDVLHTNTIEIVDAHPKGLWDRGNVLISMRNLDTVAVIGLDTLKVVWAWGQGELSGQHQPSVLPSGNLLVFDNGRKVSRSRLIELDPATRSIVWEYTPDPPNTFFTDLAGGCQALPSGNVLATEAETGRAFEVTRDKHIVWEWTAAKEPNAACTSRVTLYRVAAVPSSVVTRLAALDTRIRPDRESPVGGS